MPAKGFIKCKDDAVFDNLNDRIYNFYGYNEMVTDPETGKLVRRGVLVNTLRYAGKKKKRHPVTGEILFKVTAATRWHPDGTFTEESPDDIPGLMTAVEKSNIRSRLHWETGGFFPRKRPPGPPE